MEKANRQNRSKGKFFKKFKMVLIGMDEHQNLFSSRALKEIELLELPGHISIN